MPHSETRLRLMIESAVDYAIFTIDAGGRIDSWNTGAARLFGYTEEEAVGASAEILFTPEDRARGAPAGEMRQAREHGRAADERWHVRKDGSRLYVSGTLTSLRDRHGALVAYVKIARDLTERKRLEETLQRTQEELERRVADRTRDLAAANRSLDAQLQERRAAEQRIRRLLDRLISVQEDERRRIARDFHDHLGQQMTALRLKLESVMASALDPPLRERLAEAHALITRLDRDLDFLTWELRPAALDDLGLAVALGNFIDEWGKNFGIAAEFHSTGLESERLGFEVETSLYRIVQEALNNVYKHARAGRIGVILERRQHEVVLIVEDDGRGFNHREYPSPDHPDRGLGLVGMRERAALLGGRLEIETSPGQGTTIIVRVPVPAEGAPRE